MYSSYYTLKPYYLGVCLLCYTFYAHAQKEASIWYYGKKQGLNFSLGTPKVLKDGAIFTFEGNASICDKDGNLLFYTDGVTLWDSTHQAMPHGKGLKGHDSSTQSALIIPKPADSHTFYVFTSDEGGYRNPPNDGIHYSVVNMCLNGGKGDVVEQTKNTLLYQPSAERLAAVNHTNGTDIWVMTHEWKTNRFLAYLVTSQGVSLTPVISQLPPIRYVELTDIDNSIGDMKFSPDGTKLAIAYGGSNVLQVMDFDATTGKVGFKTSIKEYLGNYNRMAWLYGAYSVSFSPNSHYLYLSTVASGQILQFDATASAELMALTAKIMSTGFYAQTRGLQLGPDGKLYVVRAYEDYSYIGVIEKPDEIYPDCSYVDHAVDMGLINSYGLCLPNYNASYFTTLPSITAHYLCSGNVLAFSLEKITSLQSVSWDFADLASKEKNYSNELTPFHTFTAAGEYVVQASLLFSDGRKTTLYKKVLVSNSALSSINLGNDTLLCEGDSLLLAIPSDKGIARWQDGSSGFTYYVNKPGIYWVEVCYNGCMQRDSIQVAYTFTPRVNLGEDKIICDDLPVLLKASSPDGKKPNTYVDYLWGDGSKDSTFLVNKSGKYSVRVSNHCGSQTDTVNINYEQAPTLSFEKKVRICAGDSLIVDAFSSQAISYKWYNISDEKTILSTHAQFIITAAGTYQIDAKGKSCLAKQTITVEVEECESNLWIPNVITPNGDGFNDVFEIRGIIKGNWTLELYTRNGKPIYTSDAYQLDWDGSEFTGGIVYYYLYNKRTKKHYKGLLHVLK